MQRAYPDRTSGFTMRAFLAVLVFVVFLAAVLMRLVPVYLEYFGVKSSLERLSTEQGLTKASTRRIKDRLLRQFDINNIENVGRDDIEVVKEGGRRTVVVEYEVRRPLLANIDMVVHFREQAVLP